MERLLHYVWKYKLYASDSLTTTDGTPLTVIDPGIHNTDAGPDFFNAKIKMGDKVWVGSIEIHDKASDWIRHHHQTNKAYDSVILHVTGEDDSVICRTNGEVIPQMVLPVPDKVRQNIDWLLHRDLATPCLPRIKDIDPLYLASWKDALLTERLERKTQDIYNLLEQYGNDWNEVFYITLTRNFGFGVNSDAFEWLAKSLPYKYILKQRCSHTQVEALLFGQAGLLEEDINGHYYKLLQREYRFLQKKFGLKQLDHSLFRSLRTRPNNFPHLKLAQLASLWVKYDTMFSAILEAGTPGTIKMYFLISPSDYWQTHYHFRTSSPQKDKQLGLNALNILLINTVVPMFFAWGQKNNQPQYAERGLRLLESIPPEKNTIVSAFQERGIPVKNACDSQALIQLKREYCEKKKCLYCRIGFCLLKQSYASS